MQETILNYLFFLNIDNNYNRFSKTLFAIFLNKVELLLLI